MIYPQGHCEERKEENKLHTLQDVSNTAIKFFKGKDKCVLDSSCDAYTSRTSYKNYC